MYNTKEQNLRFRITWGENNLRYLAGEPDTEKTRHAIIFNKAAIKEAQKQLDNLTHKENHENR